MDARQFLVVVNPTAGGGRAKSSIASLKSLAENRSVRFEVLVSSSLEHARSEAAKAAKAGLVVIAMGGDGLFGAVADEVSRVGGTVGLLPSGRGNDFARVVGISKDLPTALKALVEGTVRELDMGDANGSRFVGIASVGIDAVANEIANNAPIQGQPAYVYGGIKALIKWKPANFSVTADGSTTSYNGYSVSAANSKAYGGGMYLAPNAVLDDGLFDLVIVKRFPKRRFLAALPKIFKGSHLRIPEVEVSRARVIDVDADRPLKVYADGDEVAQTPVRLQILPKALKVILPSSPIAKRPSGNS